ncbi:PilN domain-containing protein [Fastidiosibacter lacustris]|uniref:PilN domain-containing protein n=1 Tax=Fastidiosibacter lacustris TaxID=2056695 RepID=UPI000E34728A|nr:PilN domain-containing protein [Fastidiosibacter lacustris]
MHEFNLLPWRQICQKRHLQALLFDLIFVALIGVLITIIWVIIASQGLSNQYKRNNYLKEQTTVYAKENARIVKLEEEKIALLGKIELLNNLETERQRVLSVWSGLSSALPTSVYLTSIHKNKNELSFEGRAEHSKAVAQLMRALENDPTFDRPVLSNISLIGKPGYGAENAFKITVNITQKIKKEPQ